MRYIYDLKKFAHRFLAQRVFNLNLMQSFITTENDERFQKWKFSENWDFIRNERKNYLESIQLNQDWHKIIQDYLATHQLEIMRFFLHYRSQINYTGFFDYTQKHNLRNKNLSKTNMTKNGFRCLRNVQNRVEPQTILGQYLNRTRALHLNRLIKAFFVNKFDLKKWDESDLIKLKMNNLLYTASQSNLIQYLLTEQDFEVFKRTYPDLVSDILYLIQNNSVRNQNFDELSDWQKIFKTYGVSLYPQLSKFSKQKSEELITNNSLIITKELKKSLDFMLIFKIAYLLYEREFLEKIQYNRTRSIDPKYEFEQQTLVILYILASIQKFQCLLSDLNIIMPLSYAALTDQFLNLYNPEEDKIQPNYDIINKFALEEFSRSSINEAINLSVSVLAFYLISIKKGKVDLTQLKKPDPSTNEQTLYSKIDGIYQKENTIFLTLANTLSNTQDLSTLYEIYIKDPSKIDQDLIDNLNTIPIIDASDLIVEWKSKPKKRKIPKFGGGKNPYVVSTIPLRAKSNALGQICIHKQANPLVDLSSFEEFKKIQKQVDAYRIQKESKNDANMQRDQLQTKYPDKLPKIEVFSGNGDFTDIINLSTINLKTSDLYVKVRGAAFTTQDIVNLNDLGLLNALHFQREWPKQGYRSKAARRGDPNTLPTPFHSQPFIQREKSKLSRIMDNEIKFLYILEKTLKSQPILRRWSEINSHLTSVITSITNKNAQSYIKRTITIFRNLISNTEAYPEVLCKSINKILYHDETPTDTKIYDNLYYNTEALKAIMNDPRNFGTEDEWNILLDVVLKLYNESALITSPTTPHEATLNHIRLLFEPFMHELNKIGILHAIQSLLLFINHEIKWKTRYIKKRLFALEKMDDFGDYSKRIEKSNRDYARMGQPLSLIMFMNYVSRRPLLAFRNSEGYAEPNFDINPPYTFKPEDFRKELHEIHGYTKEEIKKMQSERWEIYARIIIPKSLKRKINNVTTESVMLESVSCLRPRHNHVRVNLQMTLTKKATSSDEKTKIGTKAKLPKQVLDTAPTSVTAVTKTVGGGVYAVDLNKIGKRTHSMAVLQGNKTYDDKTIDEFLQVDNWRDYLEDHLAGFMNVKDKNSLHFVKFYQKLVKLLETSRTRPDDARPYDFVTMNRVEPNKLDCLMAYSIYVETKRNHLERHISLDQTKIQSLQKQRPKKYGLDRTLFEAHISRIKDEIFDLGKRYSSLREELSRYLEYTHDKIIEDEKIKTVFIEDVKLSSEIGGGLGRINSQMIYPKDILEKSHIIDQNAIKEVDPKYTSKFCYKCNLKGKKNIVDRRFSADYGICAEHGIIDAQYGAAVNIGLKGIGYKPPQTGPP